MHEIEKNKRVLGEIIIALVAFTAAVTFTAQPLMRFANPSHLAFAGVAFGLGLGLSYLCLLVEHEGWLWAIASICGAAGVVGFGVQFASAARDSRANDQRCQAIQSDMLSARPQRSDGADLFAALGCRPQGEGSVFVRRAAG